MDTFEEPVCEPMAFVSSNVFQCSRCLKTFLNDQRLKLHSLECRAKDSTYTRDLPSDSTKTATRCDIPPLVPLRPQPGPSTRANEEQGDDRVCNCLIETLKTTPFKSLSIGEQMAILRAGRPTPELPTMSMRTKLRLRLFCSNNYQYNDWLMGCKGTNKLYCWPCVMFSKDLGPFQKGGFDDLHNLSRSMSRHGSSKGHLQACIELKTFTFSRVNQVNKKDNLVVVLHNNETVQRKRSVLERLIRVACHLGIHELNFGDEDKTGNSDIRGYFVNSVRMVGEYDALLSLHLSEDTTFSFSGLSSSLQNRIISSIGNVMLNHIKSEIKEAPFLAISVCKTTNAQNLSQLSSVFRFVDKSGKVVERFVEFSDIGSVRTATTLTKYVHCLLETYEGTTKLVAQTYDGAIVQSGQLSNLQAKVKELCPKALFIHSNMLGLNIVLSQAFQYSNILECKIFFKSVDGLSAFFSDANKRSEALDHVLKKRSNSVRSTRWSYDGRLVETIAENRKELVAMLEGILSNPDNWNIETYNMAAGYLAFLESFDANFLLAIFSEVFVITGLLSNKIQSKVDDIPYCVEYISKLKKKLLAKRAEFSRFWEKGLEMSPNPPESRKKRLKNEEMEDCYKRLFFEIFDILEQQITSRFADLHRLSFFNLLENPECATNFPQNAFDSLRLDYGNTFDFSRLKNELLAVYCSKQLEHINADSALKFIFDNDLRDEFPELIKLCSLIMTIPAKSVPEEKSAVKRIESYLRNVTGQARLVQFDVMAIEKQMLVTLLKAENRAQFYEQVINEFIKVSGRTDLTFK